MKSSVSAKGITYKTYKIDIGRLIIVPVFSLLMVSNVLVLFGDLKALEPVSAFKIAALMHRALIIWFYFLLVFLYFVRSTAKATIKSFNARIIAIISTFLPFAIPLLGRQSENLGLILLSSLVTISGLLFSLCSLSALGPSFSIIPQARKLVQTGPYKFVRHPVYLGELIGIFGIVMARLSTVSILIFFVIAASLIYRASQEEKLLTGIFPEYESYSLKKARFIPGLF